MTTQEFYVGRLSDLHDFFYYNFRGRWTSHIRKKLGATCVDALMPNYRRRVRCISFKTIGKLEAYAAELGYKGLSSENREREASEGRCPSCGERISVIITQPFSRGVLASKNTSTNN